MPQEERDLADRKLLLKALLDAYTLPGFDVLLGLKFGKSLDDFARNAKNREEAFLAVISAAAAEGWLDTLIEAAIERQPGNPELKKFVETYEQRKRRPTLDGGLSVEPRADFAFAAPALGSERASRAPIVIAVELQDQPISYAALLPVERHLTVQLSLAAADRLQEIGRADRPPADALAALVSDGEEAWRILEAAQPRLRALLERARGSAWPQPIVWTGGGELLLRIHTALLLARIDAGGPPAGILSIGCGDHYFSPLPAGDPGRSLPRRWAGSDATSAAMVLEFPETEPQGLQTAVARAPSAAVVLVSAASRIGPLVALASAIESAGSSYSRVTAAFGDGDIGLELLQRTLARVPNLILGGPTLRTPALVRPLAAALSLQGCPLAVPSILAAYRRAWIDQSIAAGDGLRVLDGLRWTIWSWIGRPLFSNEFGEILPAAYPHLTTLRSVASSDWYVDRRAGIPEPYRADVLGRTPMNSPDGFHLYLSGAGGTGKSCFLHSVYEKLHQRRDVVPVWYRVDAPSSEWDLVQRRIKEETAIAVVDKLGEPGRRALPNSGLDLGAFLSHLGANLQTLTPPVSGVAVFIDQLERTFESGDTPDPVRLSIISRKVVTMLKDVKVGQGVRIFIASRKQYLPDFLSSYHEASESKLQFNVLQTISDTTERQDFVKTILEWCLRERLVDEDLKMEPDAAAALGAHAEGHPLNLMLSLIQLLSESPTGTITTRQLEARRPWSNRFHFDLQVAAKDDLDWYFLLAMAAARTEIVRFEEVWWRLRLIDARLTRQADELGPRGMLERLWLVGHLGRTIHARRDGVDPARFLEFFHANLRDHLLRDVMGTGGAQLGIPGRAGGTPPVWRSLDRLAAAARDWNQLQQALPPDDLDVLMLHRDVVVTPFAVEGDAAAREPKLAFYLLFLRDARQAREGLCWAAMECFVFSALVHEKFGRWAFDRLFPDSADKTTRCERWLQRSDCNSRLKILQYLVELGGPDSDRLLARLALADDAPGHVSLWRELAGVLAEPLYAARFRDRVVGACLEQLANEQDGDPQLPDRFGALVVAACARNRGDVLDTLARCAERATGSRGERLQQMALLLRSEALLQRWLAGAGAEVDGDVQGPREVEGRPPARIELILGPGLDEDALRALLANRGRQELAARLGIPLPEIEIRRGERVAAPTGRGGGAEALRDYELELRLAGQSVALGVFRPRRVQVLARHVRKSGRAEPPDAVPVYDDGLLDPVRWVEEAYVGGGWPFRARRFDDALLDWLERHLRASIGRFFDLDLLAEFLREIASRLDVRRFYQNDISLQSLHYVVLSLVEERVPLGSHRFMLMDKLQQLVGRVTSLDTLIQKLREAVAPDLCREFAGGSGQLGLITLHEKLEEQLATLLVSNNGEDHLRLGAAAAQDLAGVARRHVERGLDAADVAPVVVTLPVLRRPLFEVLRSFDRRIFTLSFTELSPRLRYTLLGELPALAVKTEDDGRRRN